MDSSSKRKKPLFTKKHYEALVSLVSGMGERDISKICDFFAIDNPNFNRRIFMHEVRHHQIQVMTSNRFYENGKKIVCVDYPVLQCFEKGEK